MAAPLSPDRLLHILRAEGIDVVEVGSWRTHNRNHVGPWGPIHGDMQHHTVSSGEVASVELCRRGYTGLPGPLCHGVIGKSGKLYLVSAGRANHAGGGDPDTLQAVINEDYAASPPKPNVGNANGIDGNRHFYGWECVNLGDGKDPWPPAQVETMVRASAAIDREYGWSEKSSIAHREWSADKSDPFGPGMPSMPEFRRRVGERLAHTPSWNPPTSPTQPPGETPMTAPFRTYLDRSSAGSLPLLPDVSAALYWSDEYADTGNEHGAGGKTIITTGQYSLVAYLTVTGLDAGEYLEVYPAEEDANGVVTGEGPRQRFFGNGTTQKIAVPVMGFVYDRLTLRAVASGSAGIAQATLALQHWGN